MRISFNSLVFLLIVSLQACIFDRSDRNLSQEGFTWGLIGDKSTLDILYYDQGIFDKCVVGILDFDSILIVKTVNFDQFSALEKKDFPNKGALFYILHYEEYTTHPFQMDSKALKGPFSYTDLVRSRADLGLNDRKFKYW